MHFGPAYVPRQLWRWNWRLACILLMIQWIMIVSGYSALRSSLVMFFPAYLTWMIFCLLEVPLFCLSATAVVVISRSFSLISYLQRISLRAMFLDAKTLCRGAECVFWNILVIFCGQNLEYSEYEIQHFGLSFPMNKVVLWVLCGHPNNVFTALFRCPQLPARTLSITVYYWIRLCVKAHVKNASVTHTKCERRLKRNFSCRE